VNPTIYDIAAKAKVSKTAVAAVLGTRKPKTTRVGKETRARIVRIARDMGYRPSSIARALVTGRTGRIAFWSPTMSARFFQELACRFHALLRDDDYEMIAGEFGPQLNEPAQALGMTRRDVDGVLTFGGMFDYQEALEKSYPGKVPLVNMGVQCRGRLDYVRVDLYPAAVEAVRHLVNSGCRRIAHMHAVLGESTDGARYRAYHEVLSEAGMAPEVITCRDWRRPAIRQTVREYIQARGCPDGMFCTSDEAALAALRGLRDAGKRVPADVRLVGCDGLEDLEYLDSPISTIVQPMEEMCGLAWQFLKQRMADPGIPQQTAELRAEFLIRR
jgi:LacI family transcriptional regulator